MRIKHTLLSILTMSSMLSAPSYAFFGSGMPSESEIEESLQQEMIFFPNWKVVDVDVGGEMPVDKDWLLIHKLGTALGGEESKITQFRLKVEVEYVGDKDLLLTLGKVSGNVYVTPAIESGENHKFNGAMVFVDYSESEDEFGTIFNTKPFSKAEKQHAQALKAMQNPHQMVSKGDLDEVIEVAEAAIKTGDKTEADVQAKLEQRQPEITAFEQRRDALRQEKTQATQELLASLDAQKQTFSDTEKAMYVQSVKDLKESFKQKRIELKNQQSALKTQIKTIEKDKKSHIATLRNDEKAKAKQASSEVKAKYKQLKANASSDKKSQLSALKSEEKSLLSAKKESLDKDAYKTARSEIKADFKARKDAINAQYKQLVSEYKAQEKAEVTSIGEESKKQQDQIKQAVYPQFEEAVAKANVELEQLVQAVDQSRKDQDVEDERLSSEYKALKTAFETQQKTAKVDLKAQFEAKTTELNKKWAVKKDQIKNLNTQKRRIAASTREAKQVRDRASYLIK